MVWIRVLQRRREVLQVWDGYVQYPHHPKHCDQAQRETPECVNPAEYVQYRTFRLFEPYRVSRRVFYLSPASWTRFCSRW